MPLVFTHAFLSDFHRISGGGGGEYTFEKPSLLNVFSCYSDNLTLLRPGKTA